MKVLFFLFLSTTLFAANTKDSKLSSISASYDGNALVLKGQVILDHGMGKMCADLATLERQETNRDFPFSLIHLDKNVQLALADGAELRCSHADLDFLSLKGELTAPDKERVIYTQTLSDGQLIRLLTPLVEIAMKKSEGEKSHFIVESLLAKNGVILDYASRFTLRADHADYQNKESSSGPKIFAYPKSEEEKCLLTHEGDQIEAALVEFDLPTSQFILHEAEGSLASSFHTQAKKGEMHFHAESLVWDQPHATLILRGKSTVEESALGNLTSDTEIRLMHQISNGKKRLCQLAAFGNTMLQYRNPETEKMHALVSHGVIHLDRDKLLGTIDSDEGEFLHYEDEDVCCEAKSALVEYSLVDNVLQPSSLILKGDVRLFSRDVHKSIHCGFADRLSFSPTTKTFILSANPGKKVLFWDETETTRVSAQEIHITLDPETKQQIVKGVGNVKLLFTDQENAFLKQIFPTHAKAL